MKISTRFFGSTCKPVKHLNADSKLWLCFPVQLKEQALKCKQEIRAQDLNCKLLKEKLGTKEAELEQRNDDVVALEQRRDWLEAEVQKLQRLLGDANQKASSSEHQVWIIASL